MTKAEETRKHKAYQLRYKKPIVRDLNLNKIIDDLDEISCECDDVRYFWESDEETLLNALDGDEEDEHEFKKKWFTEHGRQERIEKYLDTLTDEIREQLGLNDKYCDCCKHWKREDDYYGKCEYVDGCSYHRKEWCEEWEEIEE